MKVIDSSSSKDSDSFSSNYLIFSPYRISLNWLNRLPDLFEHNSKLSEEKSDFDEDEDEFTSVTDISDESTENEKSSIISRISDVFQMNKNRLFRNKVTDTDYDYYQHETMLLNKLNQSKNETEALGVLAQMWKDVRFCDLIIVSNGREFLAHRVALAFYSEKYRDHFEKHKHEFVTRIQLTESSPKSILYILNYIYTNEVSVNLKTIEEIITCAQELDLQKLIQMCETCLLNLDKKYVLQVLQISRKRKLRTAYFRSFWYVCSNFDECIKQNFFIKLSPGLLLEILTNNTVPSRNETYLFKRLLMWIYFNKDKHPNKIVYFLKEIDMKKIDIVDFDTIIFENNFILQIPDCLAFLKGSIKMHYDERQKSFVKVRSKSAAAPRISHEDDSVNFVKDIDLKKTKKIRAKEQSVAKDGAVLQRKKYSSYK